MPHTHALGAAAVCFIMCYLFGTQIAAIRKKGFDRYYTEDYRPMSPNTTRDQFWYYFYILVCFTLLSGTASVVFYVIAYKKMIAL